MIVSCLCCCVYIISAVYILYSTLIIAQFIHYTVPSLSHSLYTIQYTLCRTVYTPYSTLTVAQQSAVSGLASAGECPSIVAAVASAVILTRIAYARRDYRCNTTTGKHQATVSIVTT